MRMKRAISLLCALTLIATTSAFVPLANAQSITFGDVPSSYDYYKAVEYLEKEDRNR